MFPPWGMPGCSMEVVKPCHVPKLCLDISAFLIAPDLLVLLDKSGQAELTPLLGAARGCLGPHSQRSWVPQGYRLGCASAPLPPEEQEPQHHPPPQQCWSGKTSSYQPPGCFLGQPAHPSPQPGLSKVQEQGIPPSSRARLHPKSFKTASPPVFCSLKKVKFK